MQTHCASEPDIYQPSTLQTEFIVTKSTIRTAMIRITSLEGNLQNVQKIVEHCDKQIKTLTEQNKSLQECVQTFENQKSDIQKRYDNSQKELSEKGKLIEQNKECNSSIGNKSRKINGGTKCEIYNIWRI